MRARYSVIAITICIASTAWAYMLPGTSLLRKMELKREEQHVLSLVVHGTLTVTGATAQAFAQKLGRFAEGGELTLPAVATYKMPGRCRLELDLGTAQPAPFAADRNGKVDSSPELKDAALLLQLACPFLSARGGDEETRTLMEWARSSGVDFEETSLARVNGGAIAEVIGAGPHDKPRPQIWIDKDDFVPMRVILQKGGVFYDARFDPGVGILESHPRTMELRQMNADGSEQLLARFSAEKLEPNAKIDDRLFQ